MTTSNIIGRGSYGLAEASRLVGVPSRRICRWTKGYTYVYRGEDRYSGPVIAAEAEGQGVVTTLSFSDLLEVRFLNAFREHGVSWKAIRIAAERAKELLGRHHPFSSRIFKTDGRTILAEIVKEAGDKILLDLVRDQFAFDKIITPFLYTGIEFNKLDEPERWWPLGVKRHVVLDPHRAFGAPIVSKSCVPTRVLFQSFNTEHSAEFVAACFNVSVQEVQDAVRFERKIAA